VRIKIVQKQSPLEMAREASRIKREAGEAERLDPKERARRNPKSRRLAINAMCWQCFGSGGDPNTRKSIRECTSKTCPLYQFRPYQRGKLRE
jgi:hypothetical protein